jgi:hypothetical protein
MRADTRHDEPEAREPEGEQGEPLEDLEPSGREAAHVKGRGPRDSYNQNGGSPEN